MFIKENEKTICSGFCIIGSGIGGGTLAKKLYEKGKSFTIVESGGWLGNSDNVSHDSIGRDFGVRSTTRVQVGGTSNLWHGVLAPLDPIDFKKRDWVQNSGWPINLSDLIPYYREASKVLGVENHDFFESENLNNSIKNQLSSLVFNRNYLKNKMFQQPIPPINFRKEIKNICKNSENFHIMCNVTALELISENGKVKKLKVGNSDGSVSHIKADNFIVCAGALETPRLLLNSKVRNKNVGKYLMDHPMGNLCQIELLNPGKYPIYSDTKYSKKMKIKSGLELNEKEQKRLKIPNHNFYLRPSFIKGINNESEKIKLSLLAFKDGKMTVSDIVRVLSNVNIIRQILTYKLSLDVTIKYADLFFVTEQVPNENSRVLLSNKRDSWEYPISQVDWQLCYQDIESMKIWFKLLLEKIFPQESYKFTHNMEDFNWQEVFTSAIHHVGTCRMSETPSNGVVDKDLRVFGLENLYICDGSVFTTAGNVNSGFTICALACRLANFINKL